MHQCEYAEHLLHEEMPTALKKYLENEILPEYQLKPTGKGFLVETMRWFMHQEGFTYMEHKKAIYFDGHEHPMLSMIAKLASSPTCLL